jgi:hypothetical protein
MGKDHSKDFGADRTITLNCISRNRKRLLLKTNLIHEISYLVNLVSRWAKNITLTDNMRNASKVISEQREEIRLHGKLWRG